MDTKKLRQKILDLAIHGKLVPQDPNDEPASVLLERIRAEKEQLIKEGKIKAPKKSKSAGDTSHYPKDVPFEVPKGWAWCFLYDIGKWQSGSTPSREVSEYYGGTIPWLKTGDLNDNYITSIPEFITEKALEETSVKLNPSGSVLIAMYGATIGKVGILTFPATTNQACCACSEFYGVDNKYLFYFLVSHKDEFIRNSGGGAQPNISKEIIVNTPFPFPPVKEQKRIVCAIETWLDIINVIDNAQQGLLSMISDSKRKILDLAIHGKLVPQDPSQEPAIELLRRINPFIQPSHNLHYEDRIPTGWYPMTFGDVAEYVNGRAFKPEEWEKCGLPIVRIQNLNDSLAEYNYTKGTYEDRYLIHHGDLLFAWAASLDAFIWGGDDAWLNQHIFRVVPKNFILPKYLYYTLKAKIHDFYQRSHGSGMVHITRNTFLKETLILPPRDEQERIITTIEELFFTLDSMIECFTK